MPKGIPNKTPRIPPSLIEPPVRPAPQPTETLASMLHGRFDQHADSEVAAPPAFMDMLPSEQVDPDPEPTFGAPGMRLPLHEPSQAAMQAGFGQPSADEAAEPVPTEQGFVRASRGQRVPFGVREQRLAWPKQPGFHLHWFNDDPGRIRRAEMAGYTFVEVQDGARGRKVTQIVGTDRSGKPLQAFLMKIPEAWHAEDMQAREVEQRAILGAIQKGRFSAPDNSYTPPGRINMRDGLERR